MSPDRRKRTAIVAALVALVVAVWHRSGPREEEQVKAVFTDLARRATFEGPLHPIEILTQVRELGESFHPEVRITVHYGGETHQVEGREKLLEYAAAARKQLAQAASAVEDLQVAVRGDEAEVNGTGKLMGRTPGRDDYFLEQHRFRAFLVNSDGRWLIRKAENLPDQAAPDRISSSNPIAAGFFRG